MIFKFFEMYMYMLFIVDDHNIFHMHLLTYEIACFCLPRLCFWAGDSGLIQEMRNSAPECIKVKTRKILRLAGKELIKTKK